MQTEFRAESLALAQRVAEHAESRGMTPLQFALGWVWNNALVHGVIGGPRTLAQWQEYVAAMAVEFDADDEALIDCWSRPATRRRPATPIRSIRSRVAGRAWAELGARRARRRWRR